ncbi:hypothetical protein LTR86_009717 [Recurvomyces mirabilis]|nr:hypothetical protein LTR86_009717 [Recurvomyces mirabilis]
MNTDPAREMSQFYRRKYLQARASSAPTCPKTCETCSQHYRSIELQKWGGLGYYKTFSDAQATEVVRELLRATYNDLAHVRVKLQLHGDAIAKRWRKRTTESRTALLLKAKPEIYKHRWVEAGLLCQSTRSISDQDMVKDHKLWLLPDLDLPGLSESPGRLLSLLHVRTAYHPAQWVPYDSEQLHVPFDESLALLAYNPHCVVMHDKAGTFGALVPWEKGAAHRWDIIGLPRALLVLEAQKELSAFLRSTVDFLLQAPAVEGDSEWRSCAARGFMEGSYTVTGPWVDQFFIAPPCLDLTTVVAAMRDRLQVAKDDLYLMQADPIFVRDFVLWSQAMPYHRRLHEQLRPSDLIRVLIMYHGKYECWRVVVEEAERALLIHRKYAETTKPEVDLPKELEEALLVLQYLLNQQFRQISAGINLDAETIALKKKYSGTDPDHDKLRKDPLLWGCERLHSNTKKGAINSTMILRLIEHHISRLKPRERPNVERLMISYLHDIGPIDEALSLLRFHRPYLSRSLSKAEMERLLSHRPLQAERWRRLETTPVMDEKDIDTLYTHLSRLLAIPNLKRLTSHSAADMRVAHEALAGFWKSFRKEKRKLLKRSCASKEGIREVMEMINYDKSAEHGLRIDEACTALDEAFAKQESKRDGRDSGRKRRPHDIAATEAMLLLPPTATLTMSCVDRLTLVQPKQKIKTRRSDSAAVVPLLDISTHEEEHHPRIEVGAASLALLQRMFTPIACSKATADIKWNDFNSAVVDAGCTFKYGGGSSVTYTFRGATGDGCVMLHRPHPDPTIDPIMFGSFGKKFAVKLGWDRETFVLRKKEVEK